MRRGGCCEKEVTPVAVGWQRIEYPKPAEMRAFDQQFRRLAKFYADEDIEPVLIEILRDLDFDITSAREVGMVHRDDTDHYGYARQQGRMLLSHDQGYLNDLTFPLTQHPGAVVLAIKPLTRETISDAFYLLRTVVLPYRELWRGAKILIHKHLEMTIRMRNFDGRVRSNRYRLRGRRPEEWVEAG
jgi:predicted nuclease of predicted toxin-antitoxin system